MKFEVCLKDLHFYSFHGVYEVERETGNEFIVNLKVLFEAPSNIENDELVSTISYATLYEIVAGEMGTPRNLLEKVAYQIREKIGEAFPQIEGGEISIEKKHPPIAGMLGSACVTLKF